MRERRRPAEVLPANLPPLGLTLEEVAAFVGISPKKYSDLIRRGMMPEGKALWTVGEFTTANGQHMPHFKRLPTTMG